MMKYQKQVISVNVPYLVTSSIYNLSALLGRKAPFTLTYLVTIAKKDINYTI